jgi:hypothetical protein
MSDDAPFRVGESLPAIMTMRYPGARIAVCPDCWTRGELVPLILEVGGTLAFVLPDGTEVQRLAGSYRFCVRCSWSQTTGHLAGSVERREGE